MSTENTEPIKQAPTTEDHTPAVQEAWAPKPSKITGEVTDGQLAAWKDKHGTVLASEVEVAPGDVAIAYFQAPDLGVFDAAARFTQVTVEGKTTQVRVTSHAKVTKVYMSLWLGGDPRILQDERLQFSVVKPLENYFRPKAAALKEV